jgi:hypothetical protein
MKKLLIKVVFSLYFYIFAAALLILASENNFIPIPQSVFILTQTISVVIVLALGLYALAFIEIKNEFQKYIIQSSSSLCLLWIMFIAFVILSFDVSS